MSARSGSVAPVADDVRAAGMRAGTALARLLDYPDDQLDAHVEEALALVAAQVPEAGEHLRQFRQALGALSLAEREELYTRTFDINPACALEIGWHLFGEEYHRGALLVRLRAELRRHGIEESTELPDHLLHVLPLLDRMERPQAYEFAACCVLPALDKMLSAFADGASAYGHVVRAVAQVVQQHGTPPPGGVA